ncbi:MAG TPA: sigma-70 family RNA polymerase sigma factor [Conexibacter sp.]
MSRIDDGALVRRARTGDAAAAAELFERHWPSAWRMALAIVGDRSGAEDVAQVALIRAFAALGRFDVALPFAPWLSRIVSRAAIDHLRARPRSEARGLELADDVLIRDEVVELSDHVELAVLALTQERRVVVVLRYWGDHSVGEIATLLDLPAGTVASRLSRGLEELRTTIEEGSHA